MLTEETPPQSLFHQLLCSIAKTRIKTVFKFATKPQSKALSSFLERNLIIISAIIKTQMRDAWAYLCFQLYQDPANTAARVIFRTTLRCRSCHTGPIWPKMFCKNTALRPPPQNLAASER